MSNHGLLPVVAATPSQGPTSSYQAATLTSAIPSSMYSSSSVSSSSASTTAITSSTVHHSIHTYALPPPPPSTSSSSSPQYPDVSFVIPPGSRTTLPSMRTIDAISQQAHQPPPPPPAGGNVGGGGGGGGGGRPVSPISGAAHHTTSPPASLLTPSSSSTTSTSTSTSSSSNPHGPSYSAILPSNYGLAPETMARYATMPHNPHSLLPRTPKKEIKRRTKTGCLTCRKRRIKCDENHPKCNNCVKSKRHCLGYDPIFRAPLRLINTFSDTQGTHTDTTSDFSRVLLPAPTSRSPTGPSSHTPLIILPSPLTEAARTIAYSSQASVASGPASTPATAPAPPPQSNGNSLHQSSTTPANVHTTAALSHDAQRHSLSSSSDLNSPPPVTVKREHSQPPPILPALPPVQGVREPRILPAAPSPWDSSRPHATPRLYKINSYPPRPAEHISPGSSAELPPIQTVPPVAKMKVDEIINTLGPSPQTPQGMTHSEETFTEITKVYHEMYARGLSAFFETVWYFFSDNGKMSFPRDPSLTDNMASFLKILETAQPHDHSYMAYSGVLETRIVWQLAQTALRAASEKTNNAMRVSLPPDGDPIEARNRIHVVETLLSGEYLTSNPLTPPLQDEDPVRARQFDFWYHLGEFVRDRPEIQPQQMMGARDDILGRLRHLLDGRENRDVLYSIAVVRDLAPMFEPNYMSTIPQHLDETDPKNRLAVASRLIIDEAQATGGTSNVVRRFCDIAGRAFVNPGVNVARRI